MSSKYEQVESGIYRYVTNQGEKTYHERPFINGKRTFRSLGFNFTKQTNLVNGRTELARRRTEIAAGRNPYEEKEPEVKDEKPSVRQIVKNYIEAKYPDRYLKPRTGKTLEGEMANCETLLEYWNGELWDEITPKSWDDYHAKRVKDVKRGCTGDRSVDAERVTLGNAYKYSMRREFINANPVAGFPRHHPQTAVHHCREFQPQNPEELHEIAGLFFSSKKPSTWALGFQLLFEANTGLRTIEVLMLRTDAKKGQAGHVGSDGNMNVVRVKHGCNPFVHVHAGLKKLLKAHSVWKAICYPDNPWFIPGRNTGQPAGKDALSHALRRMRSKIGKKITSHGMRAFYVLVRRSQGISDDAIALELGQRSGGVLIASTYGDIPDNWKNGGGPNLKWTPKAPAWLTQQKNGWKLKSEAE